MARHLNRKTYFTLGLLFVVMLLLHAKGVLVPVEEALRATITPILGGARSMSIQVGDRYHFFRDKASFIAAYQAAVLEDQNQLKLKADLEAFRVENEELKKELSFKKKVSYPLIPAEIVGRDVESIDQTAVINRGSEDGVQVGFPVIAGEGILIGKIIKVEPDISIVRLVNDNQSRIGATVMNNEKSLGVVEGGFGISLQMNLIPRDEVVQVGNTIVTSGLERMMPRGLVLGTVASIENEAYKPFQSAVLTPGVELSKLIMVSVIKVE